MKYILSLFPLLLPTITSFIVPTFLPPLPPTSTPTTLAALITESEAARVLSKANLCLEEECSLDTVNELLMEMRLQQKMLKGRLEEITELVTVLTEINLLDEGEAEKVQARDIDEIKASVESIARVFTASAKSSGNDYPSLAFPSGWTGDKNKGKSTAYDRNMS